MGEKDIIQLASNDLAYLIGAVLLACLAGFTASIVATERRARQYLGRPFAPTPSRVRESLRRLTAQLPRQTAASPVLASTFLSPRVREICRARKAALVSRLWRCCWS